MIKNHFNEQTSHDQPFTRWSHPNLFEALNAARLIKKTEYKTREEVKDHCFHERLIAVAILEYFHLCPVITGNKYKIRDELSSALKHFADAKAEFKVLVP